MNTFTCNFTKQHYMKKLLSLIIVLQLFNFSFGQRSYQAELKLIRTLEIIDNFYVDTIKMDDLVEKTIIQLLKNLDPHSSYIPKSKTREMNEPLEGSFEGIGISFNILNDTIYVISPISGGPSEKVGILPGDRIVKIDGKNVAGIGITNEDVISSLRGPKGTKVTVTIYRKNSPELLDFTIIRDKIPLYSVDATYMINNKIGYIKLSRFAQTSHDEIVNSIKKLKEKGMTDLILDLSGNGGGLLEAAFEIADEFLEADKLIVYTEGVKSPRKDYKATSSGLFEKGNLVIIIDEGSASASEILAGAIQDWDRGIIVGRRSFGKGLVQKAFKLPDQSEIRLTVARYYTPSGRCIQKPYDNPEEYETDIIKRYLKGELMNKDSIHLPDSLKYYTLIKKRVVYGGGGIMPDYFVPIDTSDYTDFQRDIIRNGILYQFALSYVDNNRDKLKQNFIDFDTFNKKFFVEDEIFDQLVEKAKEKNIKIKESELEKSKNSIKLIIKAYVARDLWGNDEFYKIINEKDEKIKKAIDVLNNMNKTQKQRKIF